MRHRSIASILLSWHLLWRWLLAFLLPYFLFSLVNTFAAESVNESLGQLPPPRVGIVNSDGLPQELYNNLRAQTNLRSLADAGAAQINVEVDSLDVALVVKQLGREPYVGQVTVYYNSMRHVRATREVMDLLQQFEQRMIVRNLERSSLDERLGDPLAIKRQDTFDGLLLLGEVVDSTKGIVSNIFNFLLILLVSWLARQLILRIAIYAPRAFWRNLAAAVFGTALGTVLVFWGVQVGLDIEQDGMIRRIIISIQELIVVSQLWHILLLWVPTWLFILGVLGSLTMGSRTKVGAYNRTFWAVVGFHGLALYACKNAVAMKGWMLWVPIVNVFQLGQLNLKGELSLANWTLALIVTFGWAMLSLFLWRILLGKNPEEHEEEAI